jgi:hypothetical protein
MTRLLLAVMLTGMFLTSCTSATEVPVQQRRRLRNPERSEYTTASHDDRGPVTGYAAIRQTC